jgi:hypothetical protein
MKNKRRTISIICRACGRPFDVYLSASSRKHCSRLCKAVTQRNRKRAVEDRVWDHIDRRGDNECWVWTASVNSGGYGQINDGHGHCIRSHRVVLSIKLGRPLLEGEWSLHTCDNPPCNNPSHLYAGNNVDNIHDMFDRGRAVNNARTGEAHHSAKLTAKDVATIRTLATSKPRITQGDLAKIYGVSQVSISEILRRNTWKHVT